MEVQEVEADQRLDLFRQHCPELSRSRIQTLVKDGDVSVNGAPRPAISCRLVIA